MIAGIVLAAGASERMGRCKALLPIGRKPAVEVVLHALREADVMPVVVVVGRHATEILSEADLGDAELVDHRDWADGRTSSIQAGLRALPEECRAVVLALVDMPYVKAATVAALVHTFEALPNSQAVIPIHQNRRGHPILLSRSLFPKIGELGPDEPLRNLLRDARAVEVPVNDPGILIDLDTPEDLKKAPKKP
jgi:molybdenum cofactor cytidylyltransferase